MSAGPLRVPAGVVRLRPVRLRYGAQWSRIRLAEDDRALRILVGHAGAGPDVDIESGARLVRRSVGRAYFQQKPV